MKKIQLHPTDLIAVVVPLGTPIAKRYVFPKTPEIEAEMKKQCVPAFNYKDLDEYRLVYYTIDEKGIIIILKPVL